MAIVVLDTTVLVAAMLRGGGAGRSVLRACLRGQYQPRNNLEGRAADRFALLALAGELAIGWGLLGWPARGSR